MATKPLRDYIKRGPFDDIATPFSATDYLIPALNHLTAYGRHPVIWESAPLRWDAANWTASQLREKKSKLTERLEHHGFPVIEWRHASFFDIIPPDIYDVIVTNPPYSIKRQWVARTMSHSKPWALLLPIASLGVNKGGLNSMLSECQVVLPPRRVDFTGKGSPWQYVAWYTHGFDLPCGQLIPVNDDGEWA